MKKIIALNLVFITLVLFFILTGGKLKRQVVYTDSLSSQADSVQTADTHDVEITGVEFFGDAFMQHQAKETSFSMPLNAQGWAAMQVNFKQPIDLNRYSLDFLINSKKGLLKLKIGATDTNRWTTHKKDLFDISLESGWQMVSITKGKLNDCVDKAKIMNIRLFVEPAEKQANIDTEVVVKDFKLASIFDNQRF
jgi:hypothetical protein